MYKKGALIAILVCALSMTGCIVINTGKDNDEGSKQTETTKEIIVKHDNSDSTNNSSSNNSSNNNSNSYSASTSRAYEVSGYIFYDSDSSYLTSADLKGLSSWELKLARNEIFARRGRLFNDDSLQNYFNNCSWYYGYISPKDFNDDSLNKVEKYNVNLIKKYE